MIAELFHACGWQIIRVQMPRASLFSITQAVCVLSADLSYTVVVFVELYQRLRDQTDLSEGLDGDDVIRSRISLHQTRLCERQDPLHRLLRQHKHQTHTHIRNHTRARVHKTCPLSTKPCSQSHRDTLVLRSEGVGFTPMLWVMSACSLTMHTVIGWESLPEIYS